MSGAVVKEPRAPFPWFGGKRMAAQAIWDALGDVGNYVEPFCGSCAVLLARPASHAGGIETVNDKDGWLVNCWRAIRHDPEAVAHHCADPVSEIDLHARLAWLQERRDSEFAARLEGDPELFDAKAAGWWLYVVCASIGSPFDPGPWRVVDGRLVDTRVPRDPHGHKRQLPHLGDAGRGVNRKLPHLGDAGQGVSREESIAQYLEALSRRLERVRITCGDWRRVLGRSVLQTDMRGFACGVLLDPPYAQGGDLYSDGCKDGSIAAACGQWCAEHGGDGRLRIVLCGYGGDHDALSRLGWRCIDGKPGGSGYKGAFGKERRAEKLWLSPGCAPDAQGTIFDLDGAP